MGDSKIVIPLILSLVLVLAVIAILAPAAIAEPNENANERAKVGMPENAVEIAPGIYSLGKYYVDDTMIEGFLVLHHRPGHEGGPGDGDPPPPDNESMCFSFLASNTGWKGPESWLVNPANGGGLNPEEILPSLSDSIADWESVAGKNILGNGKETTQPLSMDLAFPSDGTNVVYFGSIFNLTGGTVEGAIAGTGIWLRTNPTGDRTIFEWDQIYDDVAFDWSNDPEGGVLGKMDFKNIAMHEIGHAIGMGHSTGDDCTGDETMYFQASAGEDKKRDLEAGDIAGIQTLY